MANPIHAAELPVEQPPLNPALYRLAAQASRQKLPDRDDAMLSRGNPDDLPICWSEFGCHTDPKSNQYRSSPPLPSPYLTPT